MIYLDGFVCILCTFRVVVDLNDLHRGSCQHFRKWK